MVLQDKGECFMRKTIKMMSFLGAAFCSLWIGLVSVNAANFKIDVINGQDGSGIDYGTITTTKNSCTQTAADSSSSNVITIKSGQQLYVEVNEGCSQTFHVTVNEGYEIDTVLLDRQYIQPTADGNYTFTNINAANSLLSTDTENVAHALCIKYKKKGTASSPNTGDVSYVLPTAVTAILSLGLIVVLLRKKNSIKA